MSPSEIAKAFGGKLIGTPMVKAAVCEVVALFPAEIQEYLISHVWFFSSSDDAWAYTFKGSDFAEEHLIFLSDSLFSESDSQIKYTIAHEIGHVILGHKNSIGVEQTQSEIDQQEKEADQFAKKYLPTI
jgi:Zn-dependent protease with chaperone function